MFDRELLGAHVIGEGEQSIIILALFTSWIIYYSIYLHKRLKENVSKKEKYIERGFFIGLVVISLIFSVGYDSILATITPTLQKTTSQSELMVFLILAPIIEEIVYRYLLYDKWSRPRYGKIKGGALIGFIFVVTHPVVSFGGFILYWLPTLLFFMVYEKGGLKASIIVHFLYNLVALL